MVVYMQNNDKMLEAEVAFNETMKYVNRSSYSLLHPKFGEYCSVYAFTTESLSSYIDKLKVRNKDILTVTGSGDQLLNLVLSGAKTVDNFDINKNAYYFVKLKLAALQTLNYEEFLRFFCSCTDVESNGLIQQKINDNPYVFDYNVYEKISNHLELDVKHYWDLIYKGFDFDGKKINNSMCFTSDKNSAIFSNNYLKSEKNYDKIKLMLQNVNINFYTLDILKLHTLPKKYDCILLSNIYDYLVSDWYNVVSADEFNNYIQDNLSNNLNDGGIIGLAYQYHYKTKNHVYGSAKKKLFSSKYNLEKRESLDKFCFKKILVPSIIKEYRKDAEKDCIYLYGRIR